ncbi:SCP2 sterol-binding domain-containing protein [Rhabdothermincola salaria]|uniref:SCP2 sterol-binding domain-containing protein n=1 Tax=Rhabdothermincola salaria TaxID=2903142 RepID=UPI001E40F2A2|nr:SCP2 sterol-binding domain-containing protein [Rhabdothermincola salaria]MCD9625561.1 SCP2 sterol-binding domain-containing protein [Rhabdothermincola salaria]
MPTYLSAEWLEAASSAVAGSRALQDVAVAPAVVIQQIVHTDGADDVTWHVELGPEGIRWTVGPHPSPDVTFSCDVDTAWAVQSGAESAQAAFMAGRLRVGGDTGALIAHQSALGDLDDALAELRARTTR